MLLSKNVIRNLLVFNVLAAIFAFEVYADEVLDVGDATSTYGNIVRGFTFTAPTDFTITGIDVPTDASSSPFSAAILKVNNTNLSDWRYPGTSGSDPGTLNWVICARKMTIAKPFTKPSITGCGTRRMNLPHFMMPTKI